MGVVFSSALSRWPCRRSAGAKGRRQAFLRFLKANDPQDHPNNDDEEAEPECFDDQLLEPLRGQSILPGWRRCCSDRAGRRVRTRSTGWAWSRMVTARSLGSRQDACYTEVAGTLLAPTASLPRPSMLSWGEMVYDPNAGLRE
jgi:hypothetical protein